MIKVIKINRKRVGISLILIGLIFILVVFQKNLYGRLKLTALIHNDIKSLKEYHMLNTYLYKLPENWHTRLREFPGEEIIYHNEFISQDNVIKGLVQVWNINISLEKFLENSKEVSLKQNIIKDYKIQSIDLGGNKAYEVTYLIQDKEKNIYRSFEYFIPRKGGFVRFSFFVNNDKFKDSMLSVFRTIVSTLENTGMNKTFD
ncbi:hypothetical protein [Haloimpatiens lingqiaonensis]|uniref:hypothetical protein n=1 Tax=Haloimpatiens lingqiaonensis TaxID=1380675 RepID=UPI0010FEF69C|nr:hypothetical protein [Haloimpatiens lingqiaonensis]